MSDMSFFSFPRHFTKSATLMIVTLSSMGLSAYCGWQLAYGVDNIMGLPLIPLASAGVIACFAAIFSEWTGDAARSYVRGDVKEYRSNMRYVLLIAVANLLTDFSVASFIRTSTNVEVTNDNRTAKHTQGTVQRLETRLGEVRKELAELKNIEGPAFYRAEIRTLKSTLGNDGSNIYERSGHCGTNGKVKVTLKESQDHCAEIGRQEQLLEQAHDKKRLETERLTLITQLPIAKEKSQQAPEKVNPVAATVGQLVTLALRRFKLEEHEIKWGTVLLTLFLVIILNVVIFRQSWAIGKYEAENETVNWAQNPELTGPDDPIPLQSTPAPGATVNTTYNVKQSNDDSLAQALKAMEIAANRVLQKHPGKAA